MISVALNDLSKNTKIMVIISIIEVMFSSSEPLGRLFFLAILSTLGHRKVNVNN